MIQLPPIKATRIRRHKKRPIPFIRSSIFKNGLTWFDLDSVIDPFNALHKCIPLYQQVEDYTYSRKELADRRIFLPVKNEFDEANMVGYYEESAFQIKKNIAGRLFEIGIHEKSLKKQWEVLERNELEFKASVASYDKFVASNKNKREVSHRKLVYFKSRTRTLLKKISILKKYIDIIRKIIIAMRENYKKHRMYYLFCSDVAHAAGSKNPLYILDRYVSIKALEEYVHERLFKMTEKYASSYAELKKMEAEKEEVFHSLFMQCNELKMRYEEASKRALKAQQTYNIIRDRCYMQIKCAQSTIEGISSLYNSIQARRIDSSHIPSKRIFERLLYINRTIEKLENIRISWSVENDIVEPQREESLESSLIFHLNYDSATFKSSSGEEDWEDSRSKKESIYLVEEIMPDEKSDSQFEAHETFENENVLHKKTTRYSLFDEAELLPKIEKQNNWADSKRTTFRNSLVSYKSITKSSLKLPDIRLSTDQSKEKQLSSYEKRKLFDKKRKQAANQKKPFHFSHRLERKKRLKYEVSDSYLPDINLGIGNYESCQPDFEF